VCLRILPHCIPKASRLPHSPRRCNPPSKRKLTSSKGPEVAQDAGRSPVVCHRSGHIHSGAAASGTRTSKQFNVLKTASEGCDTVEPERQSDLTTPGGLQSMLADEVVEMLP
jgi:hypothetical protein